MTIRLQEVHPSLVHLPLALVPTAIGADLVGRATGDRDLLGAGRRGMALAPAGAAVSAATGLIAQEEVNVHDATMDMLITHRNINLAATVMTGLMALWRSKRDRPSVTYLGLGLAGIGALAYSAYLGGRLVYEFGVGVAPAGGQWRADAPELGAGHPGRFARAAATDLAHGVKHLGQELAKGKIVPWLTNGADGHAQGAAEAESPTAASSRA